VKCHDTVFDGRGDDTSIGDPGCMNSLFHVFKDRVMAFHGGILAYDEGMCKSDPVLAAALWRNVYTETRYDAGLAFLVRYVRRELGRLDNVKKEMLMQREIMEFRRPEARLD